MEKSIKKKENEWITTRRDEADVEAGNPEIDSWGLAFSGGGIRSAIFNLGILQAFKHLDVFKKMD